MILIFENTFLDFATISAVVAAFVSVVGNAFHIHPKYRALLAIVMGLILVSIPIAFMEKAVTALLIGLSASGVYTQVKKRDYMPPDPPASQGETPNLPKPPTINGPHDV